MATDLITASYDEAISVDFTKDAWFNATAVAEPFGKRPVDWLTLESTKEYITTLVDVLKCEESSLLKTRRGNRGGTWFHPKLAIPFARWLDVRFSIWCDMQVDSILALAKAPYALKQLPEPPTKLAYKGGLTLEQQDAIKALVKERVEELPKEKQVKAAITCWSSIKSKYGCSYKEVPADQFTAVVSLVARLPLTGELLPEPPSMTSRRWLISFDHAGREVVIPIGNTECILDMDKFPKLLDDPDFLVESTWLVEVIAACTSKLRNRMPNKGETFQA